MNKEDIAKVCHEVNRAYSAAIGDFDTVPWEEAPQSQINSCLAGVKFHLENEHKPEESHESWLKQKEAAGWVYGEEKDEELKTHPCIVPYDELPVEQKAKDFIFAAIVNSMGDMDADTAPDSTVSVISKTVSGSNLIPVKYVGRRGIYKDGAFGTGLTFKNGETKLVSPARAVQMLKHKSVYVLGEAGGGESETETDEKPGPDDNAEKERVIQDAKDSVMAMKQKAPIIEFAARNFSGVTLDKRATVATLQQEAIQMIDQYGLVG